MTVVPHDSAGSFLDRAEPWLLETEDRHNLLLGLVYARRAGDVRGEDDLFATVEREGEIVGCAFRTPPHKLGLTEMPLDAVPGLVGTVSSAYAELPAVFGPRPVAEAFAAGWSAQKGVAWRLGLPQRIYRVDEVVPPEGVSGTLRPATEVEVALAEKWGEGFAADAGHQFRTTVDAVQGWIARGALYFWEDDGPTSMAVAQGRTPNGVRVGFVYTPPDRRGRGYASALVAALSQRMLDSGLSFCVLYTDLSNPTSNRIYQRVGYRPIQDVVDCDFVPA